MLKTQLKSISPYFGSFKQVVVLGPDNAFAYIFWKA